jgi:uncharacterized membrane protein
MAVVLALGMAFVSLHLELNRSIGFLFPAARMTVLTLLWLGVGLIVLNEYLARPGRIARAFLAIVSAAVLVKLAVYDLPSWGCDSRAIFAGDYSFLDASMRLIDFGAAVAFFAIAYRSIRRGDGEIAASRAAGWLAIGLAFAFLTLELNTFLLRFVPELRTGGISILWSLFALGLILGGIRREAGAVRYAGLGLFVVVGLKVFLSDLAGQDPFYRIIAFCLLGVLTLLGAFLYLKYRHTFARKSPAAKEEVIV